MGLNREICKQVTETVFGGGERRTKLIILAEVCEDIWRLEGEPKYVVGVKSGYLLTAMTTEQTQGFESLEEATTYAKSVSTHYQIGRGMLEKGEKWS